MYKSGDKMSPVNYHPISILLPISKIYECIIYNTLFSLLNKFKILSSHQFGLVSQNLVPLIILL